MLLFRLQNFERDYSRLQQEAAQLKSVIERLRLDKAELEEQLNEVSVSVEIYMVAITFKIHLNVLIWSILSLNVCSTQVNYKNL